MERYSQKGFTLVELSIVLVIIGLIVSGVLVGQDLINAAKIRSAAGQIEKFDAGNGAFQAKFGAKPGDILASKADAFGLLGGGTTSALDNAGDGNSVVNDVQGTIGNTFQGEIPDYFNHLSEAGMIAGVTANEIPSTNLGKGFWAIASKGRNVSTDAVGLLLYYYITGALPSGTSELEVGQFISPLEAYGLDSKLDDGKIDGGTVIGTDTFNAGEFDLNGTPGATTCQSSTATSEYNVQYENNACSIAIRAQS